MYGRKPNRLLSTGVGLSDAEEQLGALPDAAEASAKFAQQQYRAAVAVQERVVEIFSSVCDPHIVGR